MDNGTPTGEPATKTGTTTSTTTTKKKTTISAVPATTTTKKLPKTTITDQPKSLNSPTATSLIITTIKSGISETKQYTKGSNTDDLGQTGNQNQRDRATTTPTSGTVIGLSIVVVLLLMALVACAYFIIREQRRKRQSKKRLSSKKSNGSPPKPNSKKATINSTLATNQSPSNSGVAAFSESTAGFELDAKKRANAKITAPKFCNQFVPPSFKSKQTPSDMYRKYGVVITDKSPTTPANHRGFVASSPVPSYVPVHGITAPHFKPQNQHPQHHHHPQHKQRTPLRAVGGRGGQQTTMQKTATATTNETIDYIPPPELTQTPMCVLADRVYKKHQMEQQQQNQRTKLRTALIRPKESVIIQ